MLCQSGEPPYNVSYTIGFVTLISSNNKRTTQPAYHGLIAWWNDLEMTLYIDLHHARDICHIRRWLPVVQKTSQIYILTGPEFITRNLSLWRFLTERLADTFAFSFTNINFKNRLLSLFRKPWSHCHKCLGVVSKNTVLTEMVVVWSWFTDSSTTLWEWVLFTPLSLSFHTNPAPRPVACTWKITTGMPHWSVVNNRSPSVNLLVHENYKMLK